MAKRRSDDEDIVDKLIKKQKLAEETWPDEMTPEAARRIEKLQEKWRKESEENQRQQAEEAKKFFSVHPTLLAKPKNQMLLLTRPEHKPLTVEEAKKLDELQDKLKRETYDTSVRADEEKREIEKYHEPVVTALKELQEEFTKQSQEIKELRSKVNKPVLFRPRSMSTPSRKAFEKSIPTNDRDIPEQYVPSSKDSFQHENIFDAETVIEAASTPLPDSEDDKRVDKSIQAIAEESGSELGSLAKKYLSKANDGTFGFYYDIAEKKLKVGDSGVTITNDDIILDKTNEKYVGTPGLWRLLTQSGDVGSEQYTKSDRDAYKNILINSGAIYQNNDPAFGRPKSSQGFKWKKVIKPMWEELRSEFVRGTTTGTGLRNNNSLKRVRKMGSGLLIATDDPVEYKYIDEYEDLIKRLQFIQAEEAAGNNSFNNEKIGISQFINDRIEKLIMDTEGISYIIQCLRVLPEIDIEGGGVKSATDVIGVRRIEPNLKSYIGPRRLGLASDRKKYPCLFNRM